MEFAKMHWRGWKNAVGCFEEALARRGDPELRQRLFTAYVLLSLRETELSFHNPAWILKAEELLPLLPAEPFSSYLALARERLRYLTLRQGQFAAARESAGATMGLPRDTTTALAHYLYLASMGFAANRDDDAKRIAEENEFRRLHAHSNLAVFLRPWDPQEMAEKLEAFPDFAEMSKLRGDWHNAGRKYQAALADYRQALQTMPVLFKASNAMGTLFYSLHDYERALLHYEQTLAIVPLNPAALFGRAICLSELGRYAESDRALLAMIAEQTFYHGEANYYLAKNGYYRQQKETARLYIDRAAAYIPDSTEMNMLSGMLFLEQGQAGRALLDFRKVLEQQPGYAEAWFFMGRAALQERKSRQARSHFQKAVENFRRELDESDAKLEQLRREGGDDPYLRSYYLKRQSQRRCYAREALADLSSLRQAYSRPPLAGLRELLTSLTAAAEPTPVP